MKESKVTCSMFRFMDFIECLFNPAEKLPQ